MPRAAANGIELEYDTFGDRADPPLLLVMGLGAQMTAWDERLCRLLADRGHFVVRFDNRDVGLSTKIEGPPVDFTASFAAAWSGQPVDAPYLLSDMADDAAGLLDALDIPAAHVVGASMGGMIAQALAIGHPDRVLTLTSIMSTTGDPGVGQPTPEAMAVLLERPPADRDGAVEQSVRASRVIGSPGWFDEEATRARAAAAYDRSYYPVGVGRQLLAVLASGSRVEQLRRLDVPTLVIHGEVDPLVTPSGGRQTAELVPGAELRIVKGMGHDLPPAVWPEIVDAVTALTSRVPVPR
jgi:pimeloyl-ACP methyl ester carboxylesterase